MRKAARAIVLNEDKILVINRNKFGKMYDTLPGGRIELGETAEEAVRRELREETGLTVGDVQLVFIEEAGDPYGTQHIFLCEYLGGQPALSPDSEEAAINKLGQNIHEPMWLAINELADRPFVSEKLKQHIIDGCKKGFPKKPEHFRTA